MDDIDLNHHTCHNCGKICKDKRGLSVHEARCSGLNSFDCESCGSAFQSCSHLKRHHGSCDKYKEKVIRKECDERIKLIQSECESRICAIKSDYENQSNILRSDLVNKIMNIDKEIQASVLNKLNSEKEEWRKNYNYEVEELRKQNASLIKDKEYLQALIANLNIYNHHNVKEPEETEECIVPESIEIKPIEYVYIIQEREFIKEGRPLYKIGRTTQEPNKRYVSYPKGSSLYMMMSVPNCQDAEKVVKSIFKKKFKHVPSIGTEYFEGNVEDMKKEYMKLLA